MPCADAWALALALLLQPGPSPVHQQRYSMGTMFDIVAYHASRPEAERAIDRAMDEIARLDNVLSHFKVDSDLSKLIRDARHAFVKVDPSLYEVIEQSVRVSRLSGGKFDVTVGPLVRLWKEAHAAGRRPTGGQIAGARRCVGYEKIELRAPDLIRFQSDCLELDLGGIGKGYAVDRAIDILKAAGIRNAVVNAGSSSIASIGAPPQAAGWPVRLGGDGAGALLLRDSSISTSQQSGETIDPYTGAPTPSGITVSVKAPSATLSDALTKPLMMLTREEGAKLLEHFHGASVVYLSDAR